MLGEGSEHIRDTRLHLDHVFKDHFSFVLVLSVGILRAVLCLLQHFVTLSVYVYLVTCRLARIVILFQRLNFV